MHLSEVIQPMLDKGGAMHMPRTTHWSKGDRPCMLQHPHSSEGPSGTNKGAPSFSGVLILDTHLRFVIYVPVSNS